METKKFRPKQLAMNEKPVMKIGTGNDSTEYTRITTTEENFNLNIYVKSSDRQSDNKLVNKKKSCHCAFGLVTPLSYCLLYLYKCDACTCIQNCYMIFSCFIFIFILIVLSLVFCFSTIRFFCVICIRCML